MKKVLIITSSGGGGCIQLANAKEQEIKAKNPEDIVIKRDVMKDWGWKWFGQYCVRRWNRAQQRGDVAAQDVCVSAQSCAEYLFWPTFFICTLKTLLREDIDQIIDTQPMGTAALIQAIRIFNRKRKKGLVLEKILVDLPTKKAVHFFKPIKKLKSINRQFIKFMTISPLLEEGQTRDEFWQKHCGLYDRDIHYEDFYVRQSFRKLQKMTRPQNQVTLKVRTKIPEELTLLKKCIKRGTIRADVEGLDLHFHIEPDAYVMTVLLGSQPASDSTLSYVEKFLAIAKEQKRRKTPVHLFVFCADHRLNEGTLFRKAIDLITHAKDYPAHFSVIPFSFQSDDVIAPLFWRSDLTCTRSGGQTAMEVMCVRPKEIWIHSEAKQKNGVEPTREELLGGIPGWESENAVYLEKFHGARVVSPDTFMPRARELLGLN